MATLPPVTNIGSYLLDEAASRLPFFSGEVLSLRNLPKQRLPISHSKQNAPFSLCERSSAWRISATVASAPQTKMPPGAFKGEEEYSDDDLEQVEAAAAADGNQFDWNSQWYPVSIVDDLDRRNPTAITIMGRHLVVSWDHKYRSWKVWDEMSPETTAPLSDAQSSEEGDSSSSPFGSLECSSQNDHASVYPSVEQDGLLWFWPDTRLEFKNIAARKSPPSIPELTDPAFKDKLYSMNLPYGYKKMIENLLEPAYLPFAHDEPEVPNAYAASQKSAEENSSPASRECSVLLTDDRLQSGQVLSSNLLGESVKEEVLRTDRMDLATTSSTSGGEADVNRVSSSFVLKKPLSSARTRFEEKVGGTADPSDLSSLSGQRRFEDVISDGSSLSCLDLTSSLQALRRLILQKDFELAKEHAEELYQKYPRDISVLMEYAFVEKKLGDLVAAGSLYSKAISAFESQKELGYDYVRALQALGSIEACARNARRARVLFMESIRAARQAERHFPDMVSGASVYGLHAWAQLELQQGNWAKARELLARAADIQPGNAVVHQSRALLEAKAHNLAEARHHFSLAVESAPGDVKCWHAWAIFEAGQGKQTEMRELFQRALQVDPYSVHCLQAWAHQETIIGTLESKDKARSLFQRCTEIEPRNLYAWQAWAVLEQTSGNHDMARELFEKCLEINPSNVASLQAFANMERHLKNWGAAQRLLRRALKLEPENAAVLMEAAFTENSLGNSEVAERLFVLAGMADKRSSKVRNRIFHSRKEIMPSKAGKGRRSFGKSAHSKLITERKPKPIKDAINAVKLKPEKVNSHSTTQRQLSSHLMYRDGNKHTNFSVVTSALKAKQREGLKSSDGERRPFLHLKQKEGTFQVAIDAIKAKRRELRSTEGQFHVRGGEHGLSPNFQAAIDSIAAKLRDLNSDTDMEEQPPFPSKRAEHVPTMLGA